MRRCGMLYSVPRVLDDDDDNDIMVIRYGFAVVFMIQTVKTDAFIETSKGVVVVVTEGFFNNTSIIIIFPLLHKSQLLHCGFLRVQ